MFREHDHHRVDPREMLGLAALASPRPAAANDRARLAAAGAKLVAAVPVGEAQRGGENGGVVRIERSEERECGARVGRGLRHQRREIAARRCRGPGTAPGRRPCPMTGGPRCRAPESRRAIAIGAPPGRSPSRRSARAGREAGRRGRARRRRRRAQAARSALRLARIEFGGAAVERRKPRLADPVERLPPAFAERFASADDGEIEREMGEDMAQPGRAARRRAAAGRRSIQGRAAPPSRRASRVPGGGPATRAPSRSIQRAMPWRSGRSRLAERGGKASGSPLAKAAQSASSGQAGQSGARGRQIVAPRSIIAWAKSPAPSCGVIAVGELADSRPRFGNRQVDGVEPGDDPLDIGVDHDRAPAEGDRGDRGGGVGADPGQVRAVRPRWSGSRPAPPPAARRR